MEKVFTILIERYHYTARTSLGKMYFKYIKDYVQKPLVTAKEYFGYTLEDTVRPDNIKVSKETGLPGGLKWFTNMIKLTDEEYAEYVLIKESLNK